MHLPSCEAEPLRAPWPARALLTGVLLPLEAPLGTLLPHSAVSPSSAAVGGCAVCCRAPSCHLGPCGWQERLMCQCQLHSVCTRILRSSLALDNVSHLRQFLHGSERSRKRAGRDRVPKKYAYPFLSIQFSSGKL